MERQYVFEQQMCALFKIFVRPKILFLHFFVITALCDLQKNWIYGFTDLWIS